MHISTLLTAFLAASFASAGFTHGRFVDTNGTHFLDQQTHEPIKRFGCDVDRSKASSALNETLAVLARGRRRPINKAPSGSTIAQLTKRKVSKPILVPTYFHIVTSTANEGLVTRQKVGAQLSALNGAYSQHGIGFRLLNITYTTNDVWASGALASDLDAAKAALRQGGYGALNLYFHTDLAGGNLGTCTLPAKVPAGAPASVYVSDGCNVNAHTMPGGDFYRYDMGMTAVHETGHWLGLLHTFEGYSCEGEGDFIEDTPMQSVSTDGCPILPAKNSCPLVEGIDAIHNYMDYSVDACYNSLTPGQVDRIEAMWKEFREGL